MIKLPKETVLGYVKRLEEIIELEQNNVTKDELENILKNNKLIQAQIEAKEIAINNLKNDLEDLKRHIIPVPKLIDIDETEKYELIQLLILAGYYKKIIRGEEEYLEETGEYKDVPEQDEETIEKIEETSKQEVEQVEETEISTTEEENIILEEEE